MHRFRRASAAGAAKEGNAHAAENSQRSSAAAAATPTAPYNITTNNNETDEEPAVNGSGKGAVPSPPSTTGFFSNRQHSAPPPRICDGDSINPFASLKHISGNADSAPDRQSPAPSSSLWRGDAPSGTAGRARGAPSGAADAEQPAPPLPSPPCFRFPSSSTAGKRKQAPLPTATFAKEHDRPNTDNSSTNDSSHHGDSHGGPSPPDARMKTPHPKSAAIHQPRGTAAPRTGGNVRGDGQQGRTHDSSIGEGALNRCVPRNGAYLGRRNDGGGDSAGRAKGPHLQDERQVPVMPTAPGGRTGARCSTPSPSVSNNKDAGTAVSAVAALPPSSQLDTVMEDHDPFEDLSAAEGAIFADASARIQKLRRRQLSVREGFARSHSRLLQVHRLSSLHVDAERLCTTSRPSRLQRLGLVRQKKGDAGFKTHADAEQLVASTFSLLREMNLEADDPRDEARSQQTQDQQQHNQGLRTA